MHPRWPFQVWVTPNQTEDCDQRVNSFSFLMTLHYFPVILLWYNCFCICTGREFVIPSGNWSAVGARLTLLAAGSESDYTQTWKEAQSCVGCDATAWLTSGLGGGFNSLGLSSLLVTIKQKLPWLQWCKTGDKSCLPLVFVNKASLEPSHAHLWNYPLWLLSHKSGRVEQLWQQPLACKA